MDKFADMFRFQSGLNLTHKAALPFRAPIYVRGSTVAPDSPAAPKRTTPPPPAPAAPPDTSTAPHSPGEQPDDRRTS